MGFVDASRVILVASLIVSTNCLTQTRPHQTAAKHAGDPSENLCIDGRLAPQLLLLGAARASTSLFAQNVHLSSGIRFPFCQADEIADGRRSFCPKDGVKELHLFNHPERVALGRDDWLRHYPKCNASDTRFVATDLTPGYLFTSAAPTRMKEFYGEKISAVTLMAFLRDPVSCMQSFFYYEHADKRETFQQWAERMLAGQAIYAKDRHFFNAIYASDLGHYFKEIDASQFIILPMRYNVVGGKDGQPEVTDYMWEKFALPKPPVGTQLKQEWNAHPHPRIEEDLSPSTLSALRKLADSITGPHLVAQVLADASKGRTGPTLYGYKGDPTDVKSVAAWLEDGW